MAARIDAFILFNEKENEIQDLVSGLEARGISTFFWRRDIKLGEEWKDTEDQRLREAGVVLVFLGKAGWGPNHLPLTQQAQRFGKRIIPILVGDPPPGALEEAGALFRDRRYLRLEGSDAHSLDRLADEIRRRENTEAGQFDPVVAVFVDGNEEERAGALQRIQISKTLDRPALAARLRAEIQGRFSPDSESQFAAAIRDPKRISSVRSWMLSALVWIDCEGEASRLLLLNHLHVDDEPDGIVRFWALAGLYQVKASYLADAATGCVRDPALEVAALARAIVKPDDDTLIRQFRSDLASEEFEEVWPVLRLLRIVAIPELARDVCMLLDRTAADSPRTYDALYALANPAMARAAAPILSLQLQPEALVGRVIAESRRSTPNAIGQFAVLLAALDPAGIDRALAASRRDSETAVVAAALIDALGQLRRPDSREFFVAGFASDTIDISKDPLDIQEDVQMLTAIMLAEQVEPPLAIGLFGDWGSGKSYFMKAMWAAATELAQRKAGAGASVFCSHIVQIQFNAWHYVDTNLWASLVSHLLERLAAYVSPDLPDEQRQAKLLSEMASATAIVKEAQDEKGRAEKQIEERQAELAALQLKRQEKEVSLLDLRPTDFTKLLSPEQHKDLQESLDQIGIPATVNRISELSEVVAEAYTIRGRLMALFVSVLKARNRGSLLTLLTLVIVVIPLGAWALQEKVHLGGLVTGATVFFSQVVTVLTAGTSMLRKALGQANAGLQKVEEKKRLVDELLDEKRRKPTPEETRLQAEVATLRAKEQEAASHLSAATARVVELEERIRSFNDERGLARFLGDRTRSEDYRKHLGLISTIRRDFEALYLRLSHARSEGGGENLPRVDRIVLYIDDLDRCPADKVIEVLQAVHLLLAYRLFVVVVGVDPRWLLNSLNASYSAFESDSDRAGVDPGRRQTMPQNYLEKIFQIPFNLRPMTESGYGRLIDELLSPLPAAARSLPEQRTRAPLPPTAEPRERIEVTPTPNLDEGPGPVSPDRVEPRPTPVVVPSPFVIHEESLVIKPWEVQFAEKLFPLIPTPRATKRFSNVYRILKAPVHRGALAEFEGTAELPGSFQVPMLLLAILTGAPAVAVGLFPKLRLEATRGRNMIQVLQELKSLGMASPDSMELQQKIRPLVTGADFPSAPELYLDWIPRVSRFFFDLVRLGPDTTKNESID